MSDYACQQKGSNHNDEGSPVAPPPPATATPAATSTPVPKPTNTPVVQSTATPVPPPCVPTCEGKQCGADDGCKGICQTGSCPAGQSCNAGKCMSPVCSSAGKPCFNSPTGQCCPGLRCNDGICRSGGGNSGPIS
jgi:hypothetical protein